MSDDSGSVMSDDSGSKISLLARLSRSDKYSELDAMFVLSGPCPIFKTVYFKFTIKCVRMCLFIFLSLKNKTINRRKQINTKRIVLIKDRKARKGPRGHLVYSHNLRVLDLLTV